MPSNIPCRRMCLAVAALAIATIATPVHAQNARAVSIDAVGGFDQYDLSGTGVSGTGGLRLSAPIYRFLTIEPGVTYTRYTPQLGTSHVNILFPEVQAQLTGNLRTFHPFLGVGLGAGIFRSKDQSAARRWGSAGVGVRYSPSGDWGARSELRLRANDRFSGSLAEWTLGLSRRLR